VENEEKEADDCDVEMFGHAGDDSIDKDEKSLGIH